MGEQLALSGIRSKRVLTIGDDKHEILEALNDVNTDIVLITGGLGPTKDDITKHTLCEFFDTELVRHPEIEAKVNSFFEQMDAIPWRRTVHRLIFRQRVQ